MANDIFCEAVKHGLADTIFNLFLSILSDPGSVDLCLSFTWLVDPG